MKKYLLVLLLVALLVAPATGLAATTEQTLIQSLMTQILQLQKTLAQLLAHQSTPPNQVSGQIIIYNKIAPQTSDHKGIVGGNYSWVFMIKNPKIISGKSNDWVWTIGDLPKGVYTYGGTSVDQTLTGSPKAAGTYPITINVKDSYGNTGSLKYNLKFRTGLKQCVTSCSTCGATCIEQDEAFPAMCSQIRGGGNSCPMYNNYKARCGYRAGQCVDLSK